MAAWEIAAGLSCMLMFYVCVRDYAERKTELITDGGMAIYFVCMFGSFWFFARLWGFQ